MTRLPLVIRRSAGSAAVSAAGLTLLAAVLCIVGVGDADAVRIVSWNILNYSGGDAAREASYQTVLVEIRPDVILLQEISDFAGYHAFFDDVLEVMEPGAWVKAPFLNGFDTDNACYFRDAATDYVGQVILSTSLRDINGYIVRPEGYASTMAEFRFYSVHLKAGNASDDQMQRENEARVLRGHLNSLPAGTHFATCGDFNWRESSEAAYLVFNGLGVNTAGRQFDPIDEDSPGNWHANQNYAMIHSQSTRSGVGANGGGMDDRFDMYLVNDDMEDGEGIDYVPGSYMVFGQDGQHLDKAITDAPLNTMVSPAIAQALHDASDHLPVVMDLQLPALISLVSGDLAFGTVIVGASTSLGVALQNVAQLPGDDLDYSFAADVGFQVPTGNFSVAAGVGFGAHNITLDTSVPAAYSGNVTVNSDDPETPMKSVAATGTVLAHGVPSTVAASQVLAGNVDFGSERPGNFVDQAALVHNVGFGSLQAELEVYDAQITGADAGRFSILAFTPTNVAASPASFDISFDDAGAAVNTTYTATLTFSTRDQQNLAGASNRSDVVYALEAFVEDPAVAVEDGVVPRVTRLRKNVPNPFNPRSVIRFELAQAGPVTLRIYDAAGQHVRTLAEGTRGAGPHEVVFDGRGDRSQLLASGVYYYRLDAGGFAATRKMTLVR